MRPTDTTSRLDPPLAGARLLAAAVLALGTVPAAAQTPQTLPGIVVQGATLAPPPVKKAPPPEEAAAAPKPPARSTAAASRKASPAPAVPQAAAAEPAGPAAGAAAGTPGAPDGAGTVDGVPAATVGSAVTVVTGAELQARQVRNGAEAIRHLPGVSLNRSGGAATLTEVRIRGAEANHTTVLIDGMPANSASDGQFDLADLLTEDIERIELFRGGHSALYGSGAIGGVINVVTRGGRGPLRVTARGEAGSFGTYDGALRVAGGNERASGAFTIQRQMANGFNVAPGGILGEEDGSRTTSVSGRASFLVAPGVQLNLALRNVERFSERDDQTGLAAQKGFVALSDSLSTLRSHLLMMGADLRWDSLDGRLTQIVRAARNLTERTDIQNADFGFGFGFPSRFANTSEATTLGYQATVRFDTPGPLEIRHSLTGLVEHQRETIEVDGTFGGSTSGARSRLSTAAEWRGEIARRVFLTAGLRRDDGDGAEDATTWRTAISVPIPELSIRPHASIGTSVKMPTMFEKFGVGANFVRNPSLAIERSTGWDAGVELTLLGGRARLDVTYFSADLEGKIANQSASMADPGRPFDCNPGDAFCSRSINVAGTSERKGVEVAGRVVVLPGLEVGASYTWLDAVDGLGREELRRAPHSGRADLTYAFADRRGLVTLAAGYNGKALDEVFGTPFFFPTARLRLDDYWVVSAAASYKLAPGVEVFGRVENLLDTKYQEIFGFETEGLAAYAGMRFTFEDRSGLLAPPR